MHTVELLPDDRLDREIRAVWERLAGQGVGSLAEHKHPTNRPHVTLAAGAVLPLLDLPLPIPVVLDGIVILGRVLAWRVHSAELLTVQADVWRALEDPNPLRTPGAWIPHISLARRVPPGFDFFAGRLSGELVAARSYDTSSREVTAVGVRRGPSTAP